MLSGRDHVIPDDVQAVFIPVVEHRLAAAMGRYDGTLCQTLLNTTPVL
jgi:MoxR-like ATPase